MTSLTYRIDGEPVVIVINGVSEDDIFGSYAASSSFPTYFGHNSDSLESCLRDLIDDEGRTLVLLHTARRADILARAPIYLDILKDLEPSAAVVQILRE